MLPRVDEARRICRKLLIDTTSRRAHHHGSVFVPVGCAARQDQLICESRRSQGMNKAGLIDFVQKGMGRQASRTAADRAVSLVIEGIKAGLQRDKIVQLIGFGTFKVVERKARAATHPKTHQPLIIHRSRTVKLAVGKELKNGI